MFRRLFMCGIVVVFAMGLANDKFQFVDLKGLAGNISRSELLQNVRMSWRNWIGGACHGGGTHDIHQQLATKSPYLDPDPGELRHHPSHGECEAVQIWMVVRHGTRNPSAKVIKKMRILLPALKQQIIDAHEEGQGGLCSEQLRSLSKWFPAKGLVESEEKKLVPQGQKELSGIGRRFRHRFPKLIETPYTPTHFRFKFTKTERAEASCKYFVDALLGSEQAAKVVYPEALSADPILRFYKGCPRWKQEVDKNPEAYVERKRFESCAKFTPILQSIRSRLGLKKELSLDKLEAMYMTCAFETSWNPSAVSPWCHVFSPEELELMQYRQDLEYYWIDGYGFPLTYQQACPAITDMVQHLSLKSIGSSEAPGLIAYFTHSGTLLKLASRLGLFNDTLPLLHSNYEEQKDRKFRTSYIDKFATNLAVVLYKCGKKEHKVGVLFQEQPLSLSFIEGCGDDLCPLEDFLGHFAPVVSDCDMAAMCQLP